MTNFFKLSVIFILLNYAVGDVGRVEFRVRGSINHFDHIFFNQEYDESTADENSFWEYVIFDIGKTNIHINSWVDVIDDLSWVELKKDKLSANVSLDVYGPDLKDLDDRAQLTCRDYSGIFLKAGFYNDNPSWADIWWNGQLITNGFQVSNSRYARARLGEDFWHTNYNGKVYIWTNQIAYLNVDFRNIDKEELDKWRESAVGSCTNCYFCTEID